MQAVNFSIQIFGGTKNILSQALATWKEHAEVEETRQEANARIDEQLCREHDERERRRRSPRHNCRALRHFW